MGKLTVLTIKNLKTAGLYGDGNTLYLQVTSTGAKSWIQRVSINGRRHDLGLGPLSLVSLAKARRRAFENRVKIEDGADVLADRRRHSVIPTFQGAAMEYFQENLPGWKQNRNAKKWLDVVRQYAFPMLGSIRVDAITREDVLRLLKPLSTTKPEQGRKLKQRIRSILAWCIAHGFTNSNAVELAQGALPRVASVRQHFRAMPFQEIPAALETVEGSGAGWSSKFCLRFLVLTASRSNEARGAKWGEVNWQKKTWTVPAERMKGRAEHAVPLSSAALAVLRQAWALRHDDDGLIFGSTMKKGKPLSDATLTKLLKDLGLASTATIHGFRSGFRTWSDECTNADFAVKEMSLSHQVGSSVERSYARSDLLERRRQLMQKWADFLTGKQGDVLQFPVAQ